MRFFEGGGSPKPRTADHVDLGLAIRHHEGIILDWKKTELNIRWGSENTPLVSGDPDAWTYSRAFQPLFTEREGNLKEYIERRFASKGGAVRILDLGSVGSEVRNGFSPDFVGKSAAVSLTDFRDKLDPSLAQIDSERQHTVVTGDVLSRKTRRDVEDVLDGEAEVILSHMVMGLATLSDYPPYVAKRAADWYKMLPRDGGLIVADLPKTLKPYIPEWKAMVEKEHKKTIKIKTAANNSLIRIDKYEGAPEELPLLPYF